MSRFSQHLLDFLALVGTDESIFHVCAVCKGHTFHEIVRASYCMLSRLTRAKLSLLMCPGANPRGVLATACDISQCLACVFKEPA
eukprot:1142022-Amphidinium_carterae.1